jgi:hypothetical protein
MVTNPQWMFLQVGWAQPTTIRRTKDRSSMGHSVPPEEDPFNPHGELEPDIRRMMVF